jgi:hypothetical protein
VTFGGARLGSINWLVFITYTECLLRGTFCPHIVFMCFVWIWEETAIISLYSINWLVFITETECVYCAVRSAYTVYLCVLCGSEKKQRLFHCTALTNWLVCKPLGRLRKASVSFIMSVCPSVRLYGTIRLPLDGFLWNLVFFEIVLIKLNFY